MTQRWYEKATVQAAVVAGLLALVASLVTISSNLYIENKKLHQQFRAQIEQTIAERSKELLEAHREASKIDLRPDFSSAKAAEATLNRVSEEGQIFATRINLFAINSAIRLYGTDETKNEFREKFNVQSVAHNKLALYTASVVAALSSSVNPSNFPVEAQQQYLALLAQRDSVRQSFLDFLGNLTANAFLIP